MRSYNKRPGNNKLAGEPTDEAGGASRAAGIEPGLVIQMICCYYQ